MFRVTIKIAKNHINISRQLSATNTPIKHAMAEAMPFIDESIVCDADTIYATLVGGEEHRAKLTHKLREWQFVFDKYGKRCVSPIRGRLDFYNKEDWSKKFKEWV